MTQRLVHKLHTVNDMMVIVVDKEHVQKMKLDSLTFMEQIETPDGLLMKPVRVFEK